MLRFDLLDPDPPASETPVVLPEPDPRDLAEHLVATQRRTIRVDGHRRRIARLERRQAHGQDITPPTDDAPLAALEPFGVDSEKLGKLDWILTVRDVREIIADGQTGWQLGPGFREVLRLALERADRWLAKNPP